MEPLFILVGVFLVVSLSTFALLTVLAFFAGFFSEWEWRNPLHVVWDRAADLGEGLARRWKVSNRRDRR